MSPPGSFHIVVPAFNEEDVLEDMLQRFAAYGYLDRITFVDDASTDRTPKILARWRRERGVRFIRLAENRKKEGAIREVLERMLRSGELPQYTVLLDADSFVVPREGGGGIEATIAEAISWMEARDVRAVALRIDAVVPRWFSLLEGCIYSDYAGLQFDHWITGRQLQLWVVNGPGGLFRTDDLLQALREIVPDFETGDLLITVRLMRKGLRVCSYPAITVKTAVPATYNAYFRQRRRWERGTLKVLWSEREFYVGLARTWRWLALSTLLYLTLYAGILAAIVTACLVADPLSWVWKSIWTNYLVWGAIGSLKCVCNRRLRADGMTFASVVWSFANGLLFLVATGPARLAGAFDAARAIASGRTRASTQSDATGTPPPEHER